MPYAKSLDDNLLLEGKIIYLEFLWSGASLFLLLRPWQYWHMSYCQKWKWLNGSIGSTDVLSGWYGRLAGYSLIIFPVFCVLTNSF